MAVVVDARSLGGSTDVVCVVVPSGLTGSTRCGPGPIGSASRGPASTPRTASCAPSTASRPRPACGGNGPNGPEYWSYWLGGASWRYSSVGPGTRTVSDQTVDGWRFLKGQPQAPPNTSSKFSDITS